MDEQATTCFYHVDVKSSEHAKSVVNLSLEELLTKYAVPHQLNLTYRVDGFEFEPAYVVRWKARRTEQKIDKEQLMSELDLSSFGSALRSFARVGTLMERGEDVTDDVLMAADELIEREGLSPNPTSPVLRAPESDKVFVVSSFSRDIGKTFEAIKKACDSLGLHAVRVDKEISSGSIVGRIQQHLQDAAFVIADLTEARPNVYYEVGYYDALLHAREVDPADHLLLVAKDIETDAHFDLRHRGIQQYDDPFDLMGIVENWLSERVSGLM